MATSLRPASQVPGVAFAPSGTATRSNSAFIGSGPNRWRAWKIADLDGGPYCSAHPEDQASPSVS